jgi:hypothetical protein
MACNIDRVLSKALEKRSIEVRARRRVLRVSVVGLNETHSSKADQTSHRP